MSIVRLIPVVKCESKDVASVYFDITVLVNKDNRVNVIDNQQYDWKDFVDGDTLAMKQVKIEIQ